LLQAQIMLDEIIVTTAQVKINIAIVVSDL